MVATNKNEGPAVSPARILGWLLLLSVVVFASTQFRASKQRAAQSELRAKHGAVIEEVPEGISIQLADPAITNLEQVGRLISASGRVVSVEVSDCTALTTLEGIGRVRSLRSLIAYGLPNLTETGDLSRLSQLRDLKLGDCAELSNLEGITGLTRLEVLDLSGSRTIVEFDGRRRMPNLEYLYLSRCDSLQFVNVTSLRELREVWLEGSSQLTSVLGLEGCPDLTDLFAGNCHRLRKINGLPGLRYLRTLDITDCIALNITGLLPVDARLDVLRIGGQADLFDLHAISSQTALSQLHVEGAESMTSPAGFPDSSTLRYVGFNFCPLLTTLDGVSLATALNELSCVGCTQLNDISAIKKLTTLRTLDLSGCAALIDGGVLMEMDSIEILQIGGTGLSADFIRDYQKKFPNTIVDMGSGSSELTRPPTEDPSPLFLPTPAVSPAPAAAPAPTPTPPPATTQ